jgi:predicted Zn-dependent protease
VRKSAAPAAILALALASMGWYVLAVRQSTDTSRAGTLVSVAKLTPAQARKAASLISAAGQLNPDRQVLVLRARLEYDQGKLAAARTILKQVVAREPDNLEAWFWLAKASSDDPSEFLFAAKAIRRLVPPLPPSR